MTLLLTDAALAARRRVVAPGGPLAALADSLAADLEPVLARGVWLPPEKARLTRRGGRCERDGTYLLFDPWSPRRHRCPACGAEWDDEAHYRWWIMGWQLWLAERAVHAAALHALRGDARHAAFAREVLAACADAYLRYPNQDNVLGPSRPFFSTYLESIWLLQLCVAADLLERGGAPADGDVLRERLVAPSAALVAGFDEGASNRQVWNDAALLAAARLLRDRALAERAVWGASGLVSHLEHGLLADGSWYEGENYHQFAHRGLWYLVTMAELESPGALPEPLLHRFALGFAYPFRTALPDLGAPARRDSQWRVSLRQWRFAEMAELGLARDPKDARLHAALAALYDGTAPTGDTGRWRSTAEAERNEPARRLSRADLGWRSLLCALPELPPLAAAVPTSELLDGQGLAVLRRDGARAYVALDYGHGGGGHGHPDRLALLLAHDDVPWVDDPGTGSYVDPSLHWYRSTLAHAAPLVDGRSQQPAHGRLLAWDERGDAGWVDAEVTDAAPGVTLRRTLVAMSGYVVDVLAWQAESAVRVELPLHVQAQLDGARWRAADPCGGDAPTDGFPFLRDAACSAWPAGVARLRASDGNATLDAWVHATGAPEWWRATAPGPPGTGERPFLWVRARGREGRIVTIWSWRGAVRDAAVDADRIVVELASGERHAHGRAASGWHVALGDAASTRRLELGGVRALERAPSPAVERAQAKGEAFVLDDDRAFVRVLGAESYRRSEPTWEEAGRPTARVLVVRVADALLVEVDVAKLPRDFRPARAENELDNEHPDVNCDGVQLHLRLPRAAGGPLDARWLLVPEPDGATVRATATAHPGLPLAAHWRATPAGWLLRAVLPVGALRRAALVERGPLPLALGVVVNETVPGRERRRGQLVLGERGPAFVYLQGDRLDPSRLLPFTIPDV